MSELRTQLAALLAALSVAACQPATAVSIERPGFGLVGCLIEPSAPGPSFRMTINDRADEMFVRTSQSDISLPRDRELTDDFTHVAVLTDGHRSIAVTLDRGLRATVVLLGGPSSAVSTGSGQCERI